MPVVTDYSAILGYLDKPEQRWNATEDLGTPVFISYRFTRNGDLPDIDDPSENPYGATGYRSFDVNDRAVFRSVLDKFEAVSGVRFVETAQADDTAMFQAYATTIDHPTLAGYASLPGVTTSSGSHTSIRKYVMNMEPGDIGQGYDFVNAMHELGHILGLSHPHEGNHTLRGDVDSTDATLMSYRHADTPQTELSPMDIEAVEHIYGASSGLNGWRYALKGEVFTATGTDGADTAMGLLHKQNHLDGAAGADRLIGWEQPDTLTGGGGNDRLMGNGGDDLLLGGRGNDTLLGDRVVEGRHYDFADTLYGGDGRDILKGHNGNDRLYGGNGNDKLWGDSGELWWINDDLLLGGKGNDMLWGGAGIDILKGEAGKDTLWGGTEDDRLFGNGGDDTMYGQAGADHLDGGGGADVLNGGDQDDTLLGAAGKDKLSGGTGRDELKGGKGNDTLKGGLGADTLIGGAGKDTLFGGDGKGGGLGERDYFVFTAKDLGARDKIRDFEAGVDLLDLSQTGLSTTDITWKSLNSGADTLLKLDGTFELLLTGVQVADLAELPNWQLFIEL